MIFLTNKKKSVFKKYYIFSSKFIYLKKILPQLDLMYSKMSKQNRKSN